MSTKEQSQNAPNLIELIHRRGLLLLLLSEFMATGCVGLRTTSSAFKSC